MFLHVDVDSFFASAERLVDPSLRGRPMAVGSRSNLEIFERDRIETRLMNDNSGAFVAPVFYTSSRKSFEEYFVDEVNGERRIRGIITSASYEARACGVKTAMPVAQALRLCPEMIVIPSRYRLYHTLSQKLYRFMCAKIPKVEQYSIDEFFADTSGWVFEDHYGFALSLKEEIYARFGLPVSIGIAKAKWIAKLATESAKPFGVYEVQDIPNYIEHIPIEAFPGIGRGFQERLRKHYIKTLGEASRQKRLFYSWKKPGIQLYRRIIGADGEDIDMTQRTRKSIGLSRTFDPVYDTAEIRRRIMVMARHIAYMVMDLGVNPTSYHLKINYEYGLKVKRIQRVDRIFSETLYKQILDGIYEAIRLPGKGAVKLTLNVSCFNTEHLRTLSLLKWQKDIEAHRVSMGILDLRRRFGIDILKTANEL